MSEKVQPHDEGVTPIDANPEKNAYADLSPEGNWGDEIPHEMLETLAPNGESEYILDKVNNMSEDEALAIVEESLRFHADDWNFPSDMRERMRKLLEGRKAYGDFYDRDLRIDATMMRYSSPYPGVRAVQELEIDESIPVETFRAYFLGVGWVRCDCTTASNGTCLLKSDRLLLELLWRPSSTVASRPFVGLPSELIRLEGWH